MNPELNNIRLEPLAIIGIGCRFPGGVHSLDDLWKLLINKTDAITDYPASRIPNLDALVNKDREKNKIITKRGGFIENVEYFDAAFFNISPLEAEKIDPAQRLLLEVTQESIENAGLTDEVLQGSNTGVFVGNWTSDYEHRLKDGNQDIDVYATTGSGRYALSGRLSYIFNLQGPSLTVDTACSSSLVALNIASQSLNTGECDMAFVGASNTITDFFVSIGYSRSGLLSEYGECRFGDERSTGYVRSEGAAMIIVKRLSDAVKAGDRIHAVVLSTACNSDGQSHKNLFAPSATTQEVMIRKAIQRSGIDPNDIIYVEAHGTGTKAGDPAEIKSIWNAFSDHRTKEDKIYAGSVKTNFGHTEAVAGLAGLLKTVVSIQHNMILPSLHFDHPNPKVAWDDIGLTIPKEPMPWPDNKPRIAGVNTFGITGTNAHAIIQEAPALSSEKTDKVRDDIFILPLSAKNEEALIALVKKYLDFITHSDYLLEDICAMAALRRTHFPVREVFVAKNKAELEEQLSDFVSAATYESKKIFDQEDEPKTVFVFPGQGAQWAQMGNALMQQEVVYRATLEEINTVYKKYVDWDLLEELEKEEQHSRLNEIGIVQPALVAVEIALASLWMSKGVFPDIVVGHSMGEVAAAYVAGNISLHEAAQIIITRSNLMQQVSGRGEMGATDLTVEEANEYLKGYEDKLSVAVMNSKNATVLSGDPHALDEIFSKLEAEGRFNRKVKVDVASHSPQMDNIRVQLKSSLQNIQPKNSSIQFYSTAFNQIKSGEELDAAYWGNNLRNPVQFGNAIQSIASLNNAVYIEMSPHPTLLMAIQENLQDVSNNSEVIGSYVRDRNEQIEFYKNYTALFSCGVPFDWKNIYPSIGAFVELPTYAWQKERYWIEVEQKLTEASLKSQFSIKENLFEIHWNSIVIKPKLSAQKILIIEDAYGYYQEVENRLLEMGCEVSVVGVEENLIGIEATCILHLGSLHKEDIYNCSYNSGVGSLQRILQYFGDKKLKVVTITNGANILKDVAEDKQINLNAALLTGVIRTLQYEYSNVEFVQLDLSAQIKETEINNIPSLAFADPLYKELALRGSEVYAPAIIQSENQELGKTISSEATYIVTGGNDGLGFETVKWLAEKGARHIAVLSRSGFKAAIQKEAEALAGVHIHSYITDVANFDTLQHTIEEIRKMHPEIKGVFHAAGVLDDALLENSTEDKFNHTLYPKANGAWNIHRLFPGDSLDIFVVYSSIVGVLGSAGQSNYAAANTFLDALVAFRRKNHMAGLSVNWGTIADVGLAARHDNRGKRLEGSGLVPIPSAALHHYFDKLFLSNLDQIIAADINFDHWVASNPDVKNNFILSKVLSAATETPEDTTSMTFANLSAATKYLKQEIKQAIASVTKINQHKIREEDTFKSYGIDSLLALQIKNKLQKDLKVSLNVSVIWSYPTVNKLADFLAKELKIEQQFNSVASLMEVKEKSAIESEVEALSLEELLKQLSDKVN